MKKTPKKDAAGLRNNGVPYSEISRSMGLMATNENSFVGLDQINVGSLQRIALALEAQLGRLDATIRIQERLVGLYEVVAKPRELLFSENKALALERDKAQADSRASAADRDYYKKNLEITKGLLEGQKRRARALRGVVTRMKNLGVRGLGDR